MRICEVENCFNKHYANGYCGRHYTQMRFHGKIFERTMFDKNEYIDCDNYYEICLYNRKNEEIARCIINKKKYEKVKDYKWCLNRDGYTMTKINKKTLFLHHLVKPRHEFLDTEHRDTNKLNNRISNLRYATRSQNSGNRKVKGYCWNKRKKKWEVKITINYKRIFLGYFKNEQDAIKTRREAEQKYFGEFAYNTKK